MYKIIVMCLVLATLIGCGDSGKAEKDAREEKIWKQIYKNMDSEEIVLLSIKYAIDEQLLKHIISEYENMVFGYSFTDQESPIPENLPEVVSVSNAIEELSAKYNVSKQILSQIIIELIMMESKNE